ncbi:MAG: HigA family addiction module antidote protein [Opitutaceae bacterium]|nr:HigA family addiction module antidote protein [Opitutaceae bacterium]
MKTKLPKISDITPGEILLEEWIKTHDLSCYEVAGRTGIPASRLTEIIKGRRSITADTALRLGRFFGTGERFWLNLQQAYDLQQARLAIGRRVEREVEPLVA